MHEQSDTQFLHEVSVVVPVYKGELTLESLLAEIDPLTAQNRTTAGLLWQVAEVVLVFDNGPDGSAAKLRELAKLYPYVRVIWLSRNFGQHSATLAGMASSGSAWIATIDEDGQHDPVAIGDLLDAAVSSNTPLVYGRPTNEAPHGLLRNTASRSAKRIVSKIAGNPDAQQYQSFRLVVGELGRSVAAFTGADVYLDVALGWVVSGSTSADVELRHTSDRPSGYSTRSLLSHFLRLVLSSGTAGLRLVSLMGGLLAAAGVVLAVVFVLQRMMSGGLPAGWTSLITVLLLSSGAILLSLGIIAEYLGLAVNMAMGKPPYVIVGDPERGPLGQDTRRG